ncbi:hypothetical protein Poly51_24340 [Rubripirellula tenax]|uniref:Ice-binding protein C-terminal domain-containing protein n=1 Tax=Rubripirellula tenax TaxID=2528015 RepID=A0A5C6F444_9BACT|nr:PEP-CTERM sorting domain-containing protein [Rubripirellula tenax]TWU56523.1 hypothetical protein Poly51_24340 [Rubripirellula tenax]
MRVLVSWVMGLCLFSSVADAAISYELFFRAPELGDMNRVIVPASPGQVFSNVDVFIREIVTDGDTPVLATQRISSYGIDIAAAGSDGRFANVMTDITNGSATAAADDNTFSYSGLSIFGQGRTAVDVGGGIFEARLGSVDLIAPTIGESMFSLLRTNNDAGDIGTDTVNLVGRNGGSFIDGSLTLRATAVPEPSSILLLSAAGAVSFYQLRRRRKLAK